MRAIAAFMASIAPLALPSKSFTIVSLVAIGSLPRVLVVHAVDLGALDDHVGADLHRAERRRGVRGEVRVAGAGREDHDAPLLEVTHGAAPDVRLAQLHHADRALDARVESGLL